VSRAPVAAFVALVIATVAAFFVTQHLKVTTPLIQGRPAPAPNHINPVYGGVCALHSGTAAAQPWSYKRMKISFYLQNRSDNVSVYIVHDGIDVRQIANGVFMRARPPKRRQFTWNGRLADGSIAPAGVYFIRVSLIHQARSVTISDSTAPLGVTVETTRPRVLVRSVAPSAVPSAGTPVTIHYAGTGTLRPRILIYRVSGGHTRRVKNYAATSRTGSSTWDGTVAGGKPAPPGTYVVAVRLTDAACTTATSPTTPSAAPGAVVTVG
jgi:flagellar hook assembly protein FlgD